MNDIIKKMDESFADNYEELIIYKKNFDNILNQIGFNGFKSYNDFCIDIRNNAIKKIKKENINYIDSESKFFPRILNETLRNKIKKEKNYEKKIMKYFHDINVIKILKEK